MIKNKLTLTNSLKKQPRGEMTYSPISQNIHKQNAPNKNNPYLNCQTNLPKRNQPGSNDLNLDLIKQIEVMQTANQQLRNKQELYINKLLRLQEGLEKQHLQFMNLQELYTELFESYKLKQEEVSQLQQRYRETERKKKQEDFSTNDKNLKQVNKNMELEKQNLALREHVKQLEAKIRQLSQKNQRLLSQISYLKSKDKLAESRNELQSKIFQQMQVWQKHADQEKQNRVKLQYENDFLKTRNKDLEKDVQELEKMIKFKQNQIIKMREDKINIRRQSSQKILNKSPSKGTPIDSSRTKNSSLEKKKYTNLIQSLQQQNRKLRDQLIDVKQNLRNQQNIPPAYQLNNQSYEKSSFAYQLSESQLSKDETIKRSNIKQSGVRQVLAKRLNFNLENIGLKNNQYESGSVSMAERVRRNEYNSGADQYFSFSQDKEQKSSQNQSLQLNKNINQQELPNFPNKLQIDQLIKQHKK